MLDARGAELGGRRVDLSSIECPVQLIAGKSDHLVPPETTCVDNGPFRDVSVILADSGHIGLSVSRGSLKKVWPVACQWFAKHS